jgi:transposase-like protein
MAKSPRKWTAAQKLAILQEAEREGVAQTCRKHELADSMIRKWRRKMEEFGEPGLESHSHRESPEFHRMAEENRRLKQLVADQALALQMLQEVLKKKGTPPRK